MEYGGCDGGGGGGDVVSDGRVYLLFCVVVRMLFVCAFALLMASDTKSSRDSTGGLC